LGVIKVRVASPHAKASTGGSPRHSWWAKTPVHTWLGVGVGVGCGRGVGVRVGVMGTGRVMDAGRVGLGFVMGAGRVGLGFKVRARARVRF